MDWDIGRSGKDWTGQQGLAKLERLPGRLELVRGKLCVHESERRALLSGLLENIGLDEVVQLGRLQDWQQAIAARAELKCPPSALGATLLAASAWSADDEPGAGLEQLEKPKPLQNESDCECARSKALLLDKLAQLIEQSGGTTNIGDLAAWLDVWIDEPLQELGGGKPGQALRIADGQRQVETLLERMGGGLPG